MHPDPLPLIHTGDDDAHWADLLSPTRRRLIASAGLAAGGLASASTATAVPRGNDAVNTTEPGRPGFRAIVPPAPGKGFGITLCPILSRHLAPVDVVPPNG